MPNVDGKEYSYDKKGIEDAALDSAPKKPTYADVVEALGITTTEEEQTPYALTHSKEVLKNATPKQKAKAREDLGMNIGGIVDELGYTHGGMPPGKRGPIKYAAGGAVRGKRFVGTF
jgi:hypothetical protein